MRETDGHNKSFVSLSTKEPHLACSLSVTVPAAVVRTVAAVAMMVVVAMAVKGTIGSNLRAGNRNRGLAARASHTPQVLLSFVLGPRTPGTVGKRETGGPQDRLLERVSSLRRIEESSVGGDARYQTITHRVARYSLEIDGGRISVPFDCSPTLNYTSDLHGGPRHHFLRPLCQSHTIVYLLLYYTILF